MIIEQGGANINQADFSLVVPTHSANAQQRETQDPEAAEMMRQVVAAYRSLSTYSDRGTSIDRANGSNGKYEIRVKFETLFKRPDKLRFAWTREDSRIPGKKENLIWCDGDTAWSSYYFHRDNPRRVKHLGLLVAGAIPVSRTTAHTIPRLLSDDVKGIRVDELKGLKTIGTDRSDGVECVVLIGYLSSGNERKVWIGRIDHLIRRIEDRSKDGTREEVRTQIVVNHDIPDSRFSEQGR
jgi:outer membrane lipoprotein-sorting protein